MIRTSHLLAALMLAALDSYASAATVASKPSSPLQPHNVPPGKTCPQTAPFDVSGSTDVMSFRDFKDTAGFEAYRCAIDWYLHSGITNGGQTWTRFGAGEPVARWEVAHSLFRFYTIMNESAMPTADVMPSPQAFPKYLPAVVQLRGAGIFGDELTNNLFRPADPITVEDLLVWVYRAANSPDSARAPGTNIDPGALADLGAYADAKSISDYALPAVAGLVKAHYYTPRAKAINPKASATRVDMVNLLYALSSTRAPKTMNPDVETRLHGNVAVSGESKVISNTSIAVAAENESALYAKNGASVKLDNVKIASSSPFKAPDQMAYRWGLDGAVVANGPGTTVEINNSDLRSTGGGAYVLYPTANGTITVRNSTLYRDDYTAMVTVNGKLILEDVQIRGKGRTFSSDHFGGSVVYRSVDSDKAGGAGGGGFMLDENTSGSFYNSKLKGDSYVCQCTGMARVYMKDTTVLTSTGFEFQNNTSMPTDIATATLVDDDLTFTNTCESERDCKGKNAIFDVQDLQRLVARVTNTRFHLAEGIQLLHVARNAHVRLYLTDVTVGGDVNVEPGSSAEIYLKNAMITGKLNGDVKVISLDLPQKKAEAT